MGWLLRESHLATPDDLARLAEGAFGELGGRDVVAMVIDHSQSFLVPLGATGDPSSVEGTIAGRAFRLVSLQQIDTEGGQRLWLPVLDGLERLGVVGVTFDTLDGELRSRARR